MPCLSVCLSVFQDSKAVIVISVVVRCGGGGGGDSVVGVGFGKSGSESQKS